MARALTTDEKAQERLPGQWSKTFLAIAKYNTIYSAVLSVVPTSNDRVSQVAYGTGSGTLANVKTGMALWVGSSAGARDLGICRIRTAPDVSYFYIGLTSEVDWATAGTIYLTVKDDFPLCVKLPGVSAGVASMDTDTTYGNQHSVFDPVPVMGPDAVIDISAGAVVVAFPDCADSWVFNSTISGYSFASDAGTWTNPTTAGATLTVSAYPTGGRINVYLTVTAANGKTFTGHRNVFVFDATHRPITSFQVSNEQPSLEGGGWAYDVTMFAEANQADVREDARAILFRLDYFNLAEQLSPSPVTGRGNVECVGWIGPQENIQHDSEKGQVTFRVEGAQEWFKRMDTPLIDLALATNTITSWKKITAMTVDRALWHVLHWRTTATAIMDVRLTGDARYLPKSQSPAGNIWGQLAEIAGRIFAAPGVDRFGRLWIEIEPQMTPEAERTWAVLQDLESQDWVGNLRWQRQTQKTIGMLTATAQETNSSGRAVSRYSLAMGHAQAMRGRTENMQVVPLVEDQTQANDSAGLYCGWKNNPVPMFEMDMAGNYCMVDLWPRQWFTITIPPADDVRGVGYSGHVIPRGITRTQNLETGFMGTSLTLEAETFPSLAITGDRPAGTGGGGGGSTPPLPPPIDPGEVPPEGPHNLLWNTGGTYGKGFLYTLNGHEAAPEWFFMNAGLTKIQYLNVVRVKKCPSGLILAFIRYNVGGIYGQNYYSIYYATGLGGAWNLLLDETMVYEGTPGAGVVPHIAAMGVNMDANEQIMAIGGRTTNYGTVAALHKVYLGDRNGLALVGDAVNLKVSTGDLSYGLGKWFFTNVDGWFRLSAGGTPETVRTAYTAPVPIGTSGTHLRSAGKVHMIQQTSTAFDLRVISNNESSGSDVILDAAHIAGIQDTSANCIAPSGLFMMKTNSVNVPQRSSDGGVTWGNVGGGLSIGYSVVANGGDDNCFYACAAQKVMRTMDWGDNWLDKSGNLPYLAPLAAPRHFLCLG